MPIYEYECLSCGRTIEVIQKFSDTALSRCDICSGELRKIFSASALQFKGSGWYVTDYAGKKKNGDAEKSAEKSKDVPAAKSGDEAGTKAPASESTPKSSDSETKKS